MTLLPRGIGVVRATRLSRDTFSNITGKKYPPNGCDLLCTANMILFPFCMHTVLPYLICYPFGLIIFLIISPYIIYSHCDILYFQFSKQAQIHTGFHRFMEIGQNFSEVILLHQKFLQFDWFRAVIFQLNLKYLHVKITNLLWVVV